MALDRSMTPKDPKLVKSYSKIELESIQEFHGKPQPDPEDPTVKGVTTFSEEKSNYMDEQFYNDMISFQEDPKYRDILINTDKLTKDAFNITVPLRYDDIGEQFQQIGMENTLENREAFYELLYTTPNLGNYTSGAILTDELIRHPDQKF